MEILNPKITEQEARTKKDSSRLSQRLRDARMVAAGLLISSALLTSCGNVSAVDSPTVTPTPTPAAESTSTPVPLPTPIPGREPTIASDLSAGEPHKVTSVEAYQDFIPINAKPDKVGIIFSCPLEPGSTIIPLLELSNHQFVVIYERPGDTHYLGAPVNSCESGVELYVKSDPNYPNDIITPVEKRIPQLKNPLPLGTSRRVSDALLPNNQPSPSYPFIASVQNDSISNGFITFGINDQGFTRGFAEDDSWCWPLPDGTITITKKDDTTKIETAFYTEPKTFKRNVGDPRECPTGTVILTSIKTAETPAIFYGGR